MVIKHIFGGVKNRLVRIFNPVQYWKMKGASIGDRCEIYGSASLGSEPYLITIGNHVRINSGVHMVTHDGGAWVLREYIKDADAEKIDIFGKILVGNNVHIGTNAIIMPGVTIGNNVVIGCGAIVTKDIPDNSVAVGIPAKVIEGIDDYISKNKHRFLYTKQLSRDEKQCYLLSLMNSNKT